MIQNKDDVGGRRKAFGMLNATALTLALAVSIGSTQVLAADDQGAGAGDGDGTFHLGGYVRGWLSFNMQNMPETRQNDKGKLSMQRESLLLDADASKGPFTFKAVARVDREQMTSFEKNLQNAPLNAGASEGGLENSYNRGDIRELYVDWKVNDRFKMRLGKQQIVWGESDIFQAMDLVNGFDKRWGPVLEDLEDTRKPLIMGNFMVNVPELDGGLQVLVRPGLDRFKDIGNTIDFSGGRNAGQPNRGTDTLSVVNYDYKHPDGDMRKTTGGLRWTGIAGPVSYSLAYLKTFNANPVYNPIFNPFKKVPSGLLGDFIYPEIDVYGASVTGYSPAVDGVLSAELAYTRDAPFNIGTNGCFGGLVPIPGCGGIIKKDTIRSMLRMDKSLKLNSLIGSIDPAFFSVQLFDTWIRDFNSNDDIVAAVTYGKGMKKHSTMLTVILGLNYDYNNINPTLALAADLSYGGGLVVPAIEFVLGDKWRLKAEADIFLYKHDKQPGEIENQTAGFGIAAHGNQLIFRVSRQF